jgi:lipoprotein signal peptidase
MPERTNRVVLWVLALAGLFADQASKYGVFAQMAEQPGWNYVVFNVPDKGGFALSPQPAREEGSDQLILDANGRQTPHVNQGALFGFLRDYKTLANGTFATISLLAAVAIIVWSRQKSTLKDRWLCASLGLILAGTMGNFYDRVMFNGVRDFLHWNYYFDWPVFNLADCCLVVGATLLLVQAFLFPHPAGKPSEEDSAQKALENSPATRAESGITCGPSVGYRA